MIHWSTLQPSELAGLFILGAIVLLFVTVLGVIRGGGRGRVSLHAVKIDATGHPKQKRDVGNARSVGMPRYPRSRRSLRIDHTGRTG